MIRVYDAVTDQVVDSLDLSIPSEPNGVHTPLSNTESIGIGREPPELKHLSRARKRHQTRFRK